MGATLLQDIESMHHKALWDTCTPMMFDFVFPKNKSGAHKGKEHLIFMLIIFIEILMCHITFIYCANNIHRNLDASHNVYLLWFTTHT